MLHHVIIGEGRPLLILHGATLDHRHMMESFEPIFADREGWQRIYVDLPGHGQSAARDSIKSQDDMLHAVMAFVAHILPHQKFAIAGESRGSYIAQGMTHLSPAQIIGAALIVPGGSPSADPARLPEHIVMQRSNALGDDVSDAERDWLGSFCVVQSRDVLEKKRRSKTPAQLLYDRAQAARVNGSFDFSFHAAEEHGSFDGPSVIIAGRQDFMSGYLDAIDMQARFSRSTLAVLDMAGHGLAWEKPALFNALVHDWLDRLEVSP